MLVLNYIALCWEVFIILFNLIAINTKYDETANDEKGKNFQIYTCNFKASVT